MLRVTQLEDARATTFKLEGKLMGSWVDVLEQCWRHSADDTSDKPRVLDLTAVTYADGRGTILLERIYREGGEFRASSCWGKGMIEQITARSGGRPRNGS